MIRAPGDVLIEAKGEPSTSEMWGVGLLSAKDRIKH